MLATFVHPNHIVYLCSWGFTHLPPTCNSKLFGYSVFQKDALSGTAHLPHMISPFYRLDAVRRKGMA
ncbi:hypothetical protein B4926_02330 [Vibrio cholerae]|nr:hypothetical protein [Vibrio cholerae]MCD1190198.1 hypothetical protein [Vibrio cholerae]MCD1221125.1 hypothetical protein [Vibrio cholerae]MCD1235451.1 hypothetical protein [Vibrio cholerae]MCD1250368.1 hypothetical protein [Vibrio cholerae]